MNRTHTGAAEAPLTPVRAGQLVDLEGLCGGDRQHDQLRNAVPPVDVDGLGWIVVDEDHPDLAPVAGIDRPGRVDQGQPMAKGKAAARMDECHEAGGQGDCDAGRHEHSHPRCECRVDSRSQIHARIPGVLVCRERQPVIEPLDEHGDPRHDRVLLIVGRRLRIHALVRRLHGVPPAVFRERLVPGWWVFTFAFAFVGLIAIAYGAVLGLAVGVGMFMAGAAIAGAVLLAASPVVEAGPAGLRAGRARLPRAWIGRVEILEPSELAALRTGGPRHLSTAFTMLRPSRSHRAVRITVLDPDDPHPAWIVTSKHPVALAAALQ